MKRPQWWFQDVQDAAEFKRGDKVRENRQGSETETVIRVEGTTIFTDKGTLHVTKAVKA